MIDSTRHSVNNRDPPCGFDLDTRIKCGFGHVAAGRNASGEEERPARVGRVARPGAAKHQSKRRLEDRGQAPLRGRQSIMFLAEVLKAPVQELFPPRAAGKRLSDFHGASRNTARF